MSKLFEPSEINGMKLTNRFVRSATWAGLATENGACTPGLVKLIAQLGRGGVGLIIPGAAYVRSEGQPSPWQLGIHKDEFIKGLREMTRAVHDHGSPIVLQLTHGGLYADTNLTGQMTLVPSQVKGLTSSSCKEVTVEDIQEIVNAFGHAATRAKEGGFDGVQIHAAHGYLLSEFLSPAFNKRTDEYGGSVENRARALREVLKSIRDAVGDDFPVLVKLNCQDFIKGGLTLRDSLKVGAFLQEGRIDAIELSGGMRLSGNLSHYRLKIISEEKEAYFRNEAKAFKEKLHVPLILVGGIRTFQLAERLVEDGYADYISMSRPFIREPSLVKRWESGDLRKATCVSDNRCFEPTRAGEGMYCVVEKKQKERKKVLRADNYRLLKKD